MPTLVASQNVITQCVKDRATLEVELCKTLYGIYNRPPILPKVRETIAFAFENVVALVLLPAGGPQAAKDEAVKEGKILKVFVKHGGGVPSNHDLGEKCKTIISNWNKWDAADCSDLSRLIGSVLEKAGGGHSQFDQEYAKHKPAELYQNNPNQPGRSRTFDPGYTSDPAMTPTKAGRNAGLLAKFDKDEPSGISPFKLTTHSTVRKIDIAFALPEGADISGTTSDSIIVNQMTAKFCAAIKQESTATSKLLQLLPLVTMISHGHHTLLESALTLTLFGFCTYQIGFYTSLLSDSEGQTEEGGEIMRALQKAEQDKRNRHLLCFYDTETRRYMAHEYSSSADIRTFRRIATTGEGFLKFFRDSVHTQVFERDLQPLITGSYRDVKRVVI